MAENKNNPAGAKREPVAHDIMELVIRLANVAEETSERATGKLALICTQPCPVAEGAGAGTLEREYPPYFNELRDRLRTVERSFDQINDVLDRAEV